MGDSREARAYEDFGRDSRSDSVDRTAGARITDADLQGATIDCYRALLAVVGELAFLIVESLDDRHGSSVPAGSVYAELSATLTGIIGAILMAGASRFMKWPDGVLEVPRYMTGGLFFIVIMESLNGVGKPNDGDRFRREATGMSSGICGLLSNASPVDWHGAAAERYDSDNNVLGASLGRISDGDRKVAKTLEKQAAQVELGRELFASIEALVGAAIVVAVAWATYIHGIYFTTPFVAGPSQDRLHRFGLGILFVAGSGLVATSGFLIGEGIVNVSDFNDAKRIYERAGGGAKTRPGAPAAAAVPPAASALAARAISGFPDTASDSQNERAAVGESTAHAGDARPPLAGFPVFTVPTSDNLPQAAGRPAVLARPAAEFVYRADPGQGRAQQLAGPPQPAPPVDSARCGAKDVSAEPARAALADDVDGAVAGVDSGALHAAATTAGIPLAVSSEQPSELNRTKYMAFD